LIRSCLISNCDIMYPLKVTPVLIEITLTHPFMKKTVLFLVASVALHLSAQDAGIFGSYIGLNANGGGNVWYGAQEWGPDTAGTPDFEGASLGDFDVNGSDTLEISAFEVDTFKFGGGDVLSVDLFYRVYEQGGTPGSFNQINAGFIADAPFASPAGGGFATGFGDQHWGVNPPASIANLLAGTTAGTTYDVEVFFRATTNVGDRFSNDSGNNFTASFTAIPEPSSVLLLGISGLAAGIFTVTLRSRRAK